MVVGERLDNLTPRTLTQLTPRTLTQRIEEKEAELDMIRRAVKNNRLREVELGQSSVSLSLDHVGGSDNHHSPLKPLEQRVTIADHVFPDLGSQYSVDHLALIENIHVGSSYLDLSTAAGSPSASRDYTRSTCSHSARGRISCASASVTETSRSFCGKTSETGSVKVQMNQQRRTSASMTLPISCVSHWRDTAGSANLVVEGGRERTHVVNGTAPGMNDNGGRGLVNASPTRTLSRCGDHVPSISFHRPRLTSPSKHNKLSPASPEYRGARRSSRLKEW